MADIRFVPNPAITTVLGNDPKVKGALRSAANSIKAQIPNNLPHGKGGGRRVAPFGKKSYSKLVGSGKDVHAEVGTTWGLAHIIEFGSMNNQAYHPLRSSVLRAGYRLEGER